VPNCLSVPVTLAYICSLDPRLSLRFGKSVGTNSRNAAGLPVIALSRSVHPMPCFNSPSSVPDFEYVICGVYLDGEHLGYCRNLIGSKVNNHFRCDK